MPPDGFDIPLDVVANPSLGVEVEESCLFYIRDNICNNDNKGLDELLVYEINSLTIVTSGTATTVSFVAFFGGNM